jgi:hypothetical protein
VKSEKPLKTPVNKNVIDELSKLVDSEPEDAKKGKAKS